MRKKLLSLLALLMVAVTGAWAKTYTVTFGGFGNNAMNTSVVYNSMPQEITNINGNPIDIYEAFGRNDMASLYGVSVISGGNGKVSAYCDSGEDVVITIEGSFSGTATIRIRASYYPDPESWDEIEISRDITVRCEESAAAFYTVTYNANGGTGAPGAQEKEEDVNLVLSNTVPTRDGCTFKGWNTAADGSGDSYAPGDTYTANAALTLYAQWYYPVTYNANGGTGAPSAQEKKVDVDIVLSSTVPTRDDYRFTGWNTAADGSGASYAAGATYTTNAALTLYAQWVPIYNVSLKVGTEDAANWAISPNPASAGQTVTATYSGKKKVKRVRAVKKPKGNGSLQDYNVTYINE
jgi:uncharacterized repeat protein (TIGR02543 family)